ncbi:MAG: PilZ domain-containing protein [Desulfobacterales bacterium]
MSAALTADQDKPVTTVYADESDRVDVCCHECGFFKTIDVSMLKKSSRTLKIKCRCGHTFRNRVEFRRAFRKRVKLDGTYLHISSGMRASMVVEDISRAGIGISVQPKHGFVPGDTMLLTFNLDNVRRTKIKKKVKIMSVRNTYLGTQSLDASQYDKDLGFYLMG